MGPQKRAFIRVNQRRRGVTASQTPALSVSQCRFYLKQHLNYELQWLLRAAQEWAVQEELQLNVDGYQVQVYAMDSTFLHARNLFEFLAAKRPSGNYYTCRDFNVQPRSSPLYCSWTKILHGFVMHAQDRSSPQKLNAPDGSKKDLQEMPVEFAREIVRLWKDFVVALSKRNPKLAAEARAILEDAADNAQRVARNNVVKMVSEREIRPIQW